MDPLTPTTSTLVPAISHIAETAVTLSNELAAHVPAKNDDTLRQKRERQTVQWVLDAPNRLGRLVEDGKPADAARDWDQVRSLLDRWKGVQGVEGVRIACERALDTDER